MKAAALILCAASLITLPACGIKPGEVSAPGGPAAGAPRTYPQAETSRIAVPAPHVN